MESLVAMIGVFFAPTAMITLIVWMKSNERSKRYRLQADLFTKALEKGQPVPPDLFAEPAKAERKRSSIPLRTGLICIGTGIGIMLAFWINAILMTSELRRGGEVEFFKICGSFGIIPLLIGVAFVIIHFIEKKKNVNEYAQ
jgi:hypothetical protein